MGVSLGKLFLSAHGSTKRNFHCARWPSRRACDICGTESKALSDPFKLFGRLILAGFKITGYLLTGVVEAAWYVAHGRRDLLGQVIGDLGRSVTNAFAKVLGD